MSIDHRNLHRLAVTSGDRFVGILTQSRIVRKFSLHISDFNFGNQYIRDLNLGIKPVVTVNENDTVTDAINCICKNKISGVGIIDKDGKLIGFHTHDWYFDTSSTCSLPCLSILWSSLQKPTFDLCLQKPSRVLITCSRVDQIHTKPTKVGWCKPFF
eukprot:TRINITY_DN3973_c0_g1_i13.p1 TRINITY_DN3973_c0_g1~~TRINITY_DN3973_c0_g1_i13.p1  ORF type:complete len:157 (+),score=14.18 TRINITY_DN3973_c0_g1_i13:489-959(+)